MKRFFAMILLLVLCACLCSCSEKTYAVHVKAPDSWDSVNLWAWSTEKKKDAFKEWPGALMTADEDGWYTAMVPESVDVVIVSGNGGTIQTEEIKYISREVWITVYEDLSNWRQSEKPEYITATVIVPDNWGTPNCWASSSADKKDVFAERPGLPMTKNDTGYTIELPAWIDHVFITSEDGANNTTNLAVESGKDFWLVMWDTNNMDLVYSEAELDDLLTYSAEALYAGIEGMDKSTITGDKSLTCIYYIESRQEKSRQPVLDFIPGEETPTTREEIRYMVNYTYEASRHTGYIGILKVFNTSIKVEIIDLYYDRVIAEESFPGGELPEKVSAPMGTNYYADYPDEAPIKQWVADQLSKAR